VRENRLEVGGRLSSYLHWVLWLLGTVAIPEMYAPVLLQKRAQRLSQETEKIYKSKLEIEKGPKSPIKVFHTALGRPWLLLFLEPIVLLLATYRAIVFGTLYMFFGAFPIVYQKERGWSEGLGGLAFVGVALGMLSGVVYAIPENFRYGRLVSKAEGKLAPPEQRLVSAMVAAPCFPIGVSTFAEGIFWISRSGLFSP
jgi:hypothetical protein